MVEDTIAVIRIDCILHVLAGCLALAVACLCAAGLLRVADDAKVKRLYMLISVPVIALVIIPCLFTFVVYGLNFWNWIGIFWPGLTLQHMQMLRDL